MFDMNFDWYISCSSCKERALGRVAVALEKFVLDHPDFKVFTANITNERCARTGVNYLMRMIVVKPPCYKWKERSDKHAGILIVYLHLLKVGTVLYFVCFFDNDLRFHLQHPTVGTSCSWSSQR